MKKLTKFVFSVFIGMFILAACQNKSLPRAERIIGLIQENVTAITNNLSEIQNIENTLQSSFEEAIAFNDLSIFSNEDNAVNVNIQARQEKINAIIDARKSNQDLIKEMTSLIGQPNVPGEQIKTIISQIEALNADLEVYTTDYNNALKLESQSFESIAAENSNYETFFNVLNNVNTLAVTNNMNLNKVVGQFEQINIHLVNVKVEIINLIQSLK